MNPLNEVAKGITGKSVTDMVTSADTVNLSIWALVVMLFVFITAMVIIIKVFLSSSNRTNEGLKVIIQQNAEQLHIFRESLDKMSENFWLLSENIARMQIVKLAEENKLDTLMQRFQDLKQEISGSHINLHNVFREHEKNSHDSHADIQQNMEKFKAIMLEMKAFYCGMSSGKEKRLGDILVEMGVCTREQINQALRKQMELEDGSIC